MQLATPASTRLLSFFLRSRPPPPPLLTDHYKTLKTTPLPPTPLRRGITSSVPMALSAGAADDEEEETASAGDGEDVNSGWEMVSVEEWQRWGTSSPMPAMVAELLHQLLDLEEEVGDKMRFAGVGCKLQGDFKTLEDKKHRAAYKTLADSEKLQYFSARQIACRLLGSRGYLCQKCWLPLEEDCMCERLVPLKLWSGIRFWIYMHPRDFLRQNNTGKLLWQTFGVEAASLCLFAIHGQEEIMWNAFKHSGKGMVWFLYPNKSNSPKSVQDVNFDGLLTSSDVQKKDFQDKPVNFVLLDGTWSNSAAMYRRLKERWSATFGEEELPCISLSSLGASVMHKLRPQPAWDRTCTAAAAAGLLWELHQRLDLNEVGLGEQAEVVESSLDVLLDALTGRRLRMGRSTTRKGRPI